MAANPNDAALRQAIYFEALKNHEMTYGVEVSQAVFKIVNTALTGLGVSYLYELTKKQFAALLTVVKTRLKSLFGTVADETIKRIKAVMSAEYQVTKAVFASVYSVAKSALPTTTAVKLWADVRNERISGTGALPEATFRDYYSAAIAAVLGMISKAYSDKQTVAELIVAIRGLAADGFKTGLIHKLARQYGATMSTVLSHVSSRVTQILGRAVSDKYVWLSVLDSRTTDICRERNGNIYDYGSGPIPPAHYRCRSKTRPYVVTVPAVPRTFFGWLRVQPKSFVADAFGAVMAENIEAGKKVADKYESTLRLTAKEYKTKVNNITE